MCHCKAFLSIKKHTRNRKDNPGTINEATTEENVVPYPRDGTSVEVETNTERAIGGQ